MSTQLYAEGKVALAAVVAGTEAEVVIGNDPCDDGSWPVDIVRDGQRITGFAWCGEPNDVNCVESPGWYECDDDGCWGPDPLTPDQMAEVVERALAVADQKVKDEAVRQIEEAVEAANDKLLELALEQVDDDDVNGIDNERREHSQHHLTAIYLRSGRPDDADEDGDVPAWVKVVKLDDAEAVVIDDGTGDWADYVDEYNPPIQLTASDATERVQDRLTEETDHAEEMYETGQWS